MSYTTSTSNKGVQYQKLLKLAAFMETNVLPEHFDMDTYYYGDPKNPDCGTCACIGGWATVCFPNSQLKLYGGEIKYRNCEGEALDACAALARFFGLSDEDQRFLFAPNRLVYRPYKVNTPAEAAKHLRDFVTRKKAEKAEQGGQV